MQDDQFKPPKPLPSTTIKGRIGAKTRTAIEAMASEGISAYTAAQRVGMAPTSLKRALRRISGKKLYNQLVKEIRDNAAQAAYLRIVHQSTNAPNDRLKFDANRWIAGVDGISPVQKVAGNHLIRHEFGGFAYDQPDVVDATVTDNVSDVVED